MVGLASMRIEENKPLAPLTTLASEVQRGGTSRRKTKTILSRPAAWAREKGIPLFVLGGGSNPFVADADNGLVLHIGLKGISALEAIRN